MPKCQECGKKSPLLYGNSVLGKWVCEACDLANDDHENDEEIKRMKNKSTIIKPKK